MIRNIFLLMLSALCAWSCTDNLPGDEAPTDGRHSLNITVGPKPAFTDGTLTRADGTILPETRAVQTDEGTKWEEGDVVWLRAKFQDADGTLSTFYSALKYTGGVWRYLTGDEAAALGVSSYAGFNRTLTYDEPDGSIKYTDVFISATYAGNGKPDASGRITFPAPGSSEAVPVMQATAGISGYLGQPLTLSFTYLCSRLRIPAGCDALKVSAHRYCISYGLSTGILDIETTPRPVLFPAAGAPRDIYLLPVADDDGTPSLLTLTRDGSAWSLTPQPVTAYFGLSYTLPSLDPGDVKPGDM